MAGQAVVRFYLRGDDLMFELTKSPHGEYQGPPTHIVVKADEGHAKSYQMAFEQFRKDNPEYKAPWEPPTSPIESASVLVESLLDAAKLESETLVETEIQ